MYISERVTAVERLPILKHEHKNKLLTVPILLPEQKEILFSLYCVEDCNENKSVLTIRYNVLFSYDFQRTINNDYTVY
jgi:hypothetical protein